MIGATGEESGSTGIDGNQSDNSANYAGAAYVFARSSGMWNQQAYLKASNTGQFDYFGQSVSVSGDTVVVGANGEDSYGLGVNDDGSDDFASSAGAAYVFRRSGETWGQLAYLKASNTETGDEFGWSVSISDDIVIVGAWNEDSGATGINGDEHDESATDAGAAYAFLLGDFLDPPSKNVPMPDLLVGEKSGIRKQKGDNIYNSTGAGQKVKIRKSNKAATVHVRVQNDGGTAGEFRFLTTRGNRKAMVNYFSFDGGSRRNVTGLITKGNYKANLGAKQSFRIMAKVRMTRRAGATARTQIKVTTTASGHSDTVMAKVILKPSR